jgi:hypothetical protein
MARREVQPETVPGVQGEAGKDAPVEAEAEAKAAGNAGTKTVLIRHKTPYRNYRCAGLLLKQQQETCRVTSEQLEKLLRDPWVEVLEAKTE